MKSMFIVFIALCNIMLFPLLSFPIIAYLCLLLFMEGGNLLLVCLGLVLFGFIWAYVLWSECWALAWTFTDAVAGGVWFAVLLWACVILVFDVGVATLQFIYCCKCGAWGCEIFGGERCTTLGLDCCTSLYWCAWAVQSCLGLLLERFWEVKIGGCYRSFVFDVHQVRLFLIVLRWLCF